MNLYIIIGKAKIYTMYLMILNTVRADGLSAEFTGLYVSVVSLTGLYVSVVSFTGDELVDKCSNFIEDKSSSYCLYVL